MEVEKHGASVGWNAHAATPSAQPADEIIPPAAVEYEAAAAIRLLPAIKFSGKAPAKASKL